MGEFELIRRHFARPVRRAVLGGGDDCALLALPPGQQWAVSCDTLVEGRHFLSTVPPAALGHKALAVNLSDLAACGAQPQAFTLGLCLPRADEAFVCGFAEGLYALADAAGIELVGGDTTAGPLAVHITVMGSVPSGQALLRSGAKAGDALWVSGRLGDARLALEAFRGNVSLDESTFAACRRAMEWPQARCALGQALRGVAHSAIDLSDGLLGDLGHVLVASGVGADIDFDALPRSPWLAAMPHTLQQSCLLTGGDDYELLFSSTPQRSAEVLAAAAAAGVAVTRIGTLSAQAGLRVRRANGQDMALDGLQAFDHFVAQAAP